MNRAVRYAVEQEHEYFTLEHVLWSLLAEAQIANIVHACGGVPGTLRSELETYLQSEVPKAGPRAGWASTRGVPSESAESEESANLGGEPDEGESESEDENENENENEGEEAEGSVEHPVATLGVQRLIQRALFHVQSAGKDEIQPVDLFVALFQARDSHALHLLTKQGVERLDVLSYISHGVRKNGEVDGGLPSETGRGTEPEGEPGPGFFDEVKGQLSGGDGAGANRGSSSEQGRAPGGASSLDDPLENFAMNLNERAREGKIDPLIGRQNELERLIQTLCRRRKNNPLLVGEAGVGKTALAEGLALRIIEHNVPDLLSNAVVYALDLGALLAGAKFRGDFEQRLKKVLTALHRKRERGQQPILLIDEIHTIVGAGAVSGGALDAANLLKPVLAQGEIRCIGSTTYNEYRNVFEKDHALARRFQKIDVAEPSVEEAIQVLDGLKARFEEHHRVRFTPEAIRAAVELSSKHLTERFLPDKAIDVIDEAGAKARLKIKAQGEPRPVLDSPAIEEIIAQIARIPARSISSSQKDRLKNLERDLRLTIFGQDHAIEALVTSIRLARSGLRTGERPVGSFLFCGPTGVGKTELSKQLGHCMGVPFLRFDMSEYSEKHTLSRLIGAPPGYVGFEQAGLLTDAVLKNPHSVILLDEIEKAHSDIWNILLQVMDHGTLTDNNGRRADFRNIVLIMTSNVGSRDLERRQLGLVAGENKGTSAQRAVEQTFTPEFRNRLDAIVYFNPLDPLTVGQVVGKQLLELESQLLAKHVELVVGVDARELLAQRGYDRQMGARPLARIIQERIKKPLAEEILFGRLESGGEVRIFVRDGELAYEVKASGKEAGSPNESVPVSSENHRG
ncbi:MAG: AAA family ATPase [Oligoflexia bacterium]|nr:AAA family ATPase [Oligoflexia bacterium]